MNNFAPIVIPTLCRYEHFVQCIESLKSCTHAEHTILIVGLDYPPNEKYLEGYKRIKEYLEAGICGFKSVEIIAHKENFGAIKNCEYLKKYAFEHYDRVIFTEDDNVFSPNFLDYMNKALSIYEKEERVSSVSGYSLIQFQEVKSNSGILFTRNNSAWGLGLWKAKENIYESKGLDYYIDIILNNSKSRKVLHSYPAAYHMLLEMINSKTRYGDTQRTCVNIIENMYQLCPAISMVRNMGHDGTGIHCGESSKDSFVNQIIDKRDVFSFSNIDIAYTSEIKRIEAKLWMPSTLLDLLKKYIIIAKEVIQIRHSII